MKNNKLVLNYCRNFEKIINTDFEENDTLSLQLVKIYKDYIFKSRKGNQSIHRSRAYCIIKEAAKAEGIEGIISCHTMRKTFGYHAWKKGIPPAVIMDIYNHSSIEITKAYLSINQDDRDDVYKKILL